MSAAICWSGVVRRFKVPPPPKPGFVGTARHLRGRVTIRGGTVRMEVLNTRTEQVLASDTVALNTIYGRGTGLPHLFDECVAAVAAARGSWTYEYRRKDLT